MRKKIKHNKKIGTPPGSVVYTGESQITDTNIELYSYCENRNIKEKLHSIENLNFRKECVNWLNIDGVHDVEVIKKIGEKFQIDNLILEDIADVKQRAKLEERENFLFIVVKMFQFDKKNGKVTSEQVSMIVGNDYLITFQEDIGDVFDHIRNRIENGIGKIRKRGADYLAYLLLDSIVDNYFLVLENIEYEIDQLEERLLDKSNKEELRTIIKLKQDFIYFKRATLPVRELAIRLSHNRELDIFKDDMGIYLNDLQDHVLIIHEIIENLSNRVTGLIELYHSTLNGIMNETMKFLTIVSTIFVPLTFLAGLYGMNFQHMPELAWKYGYFGVLIVMLSAACGLVYLFRRKNWI